MRSLIVTVLALLAGCAQTQVITLSTKPSDATLMIDGVPSGHAPVTYKFEFRKPDDTHTVVASRSGYKDQVVSVPSSFHDAAMLIEMRPMTRLLTFNVTPVPGIISIDGKRISEEPVAQVSRELEFTRDAKERWTTHRITAERAGYQAAELTVSWTDQQPNYVLDLEAVRKDLAVSATPESAEIYLDEQLLGAGKVTYAGYAFAMDPKTNRFVPHKLRAVAPGYPPKEIPISWDEGRTDYRIALEPFTKTVEIVTDPADATLAVEGAKLARDPKSGKATAKLVFSPVNDKGDLKTYPGIATKKTDASEWKPAKFVIGWDDGKTQYPVHLEEIKTRPVALLRVKYSHSENGWKVQCDRLSTLAMKDVSEGATHATAKRILRAGKDASIDSLAVSPDGAQIVYTVLAQNPAGVLTSQIIAAHSDGASGLSMLSDGKSLDLAPSYTPDGTQVVFSSNRFGNRQSILVMPVAGDMGVSKMTGGDSDDLWPTVDSSPQPRLFYEARMNNRPDPRLFMTQLGTTVLTDLTPAGGMQPRIGPKADTVVFAAINEKSGKRDLYKMSDRGGRADNLTNTADVDEFDAAWSNDGRRLAFVCDRGLSKEMPDNYDIWVMDLAHPEKPTQITFNGSYDDRPCWDADGKSIYFRSNRGGEWGIWKVEAK